jgi:hypothetical protein
MDTGVERDRPVRIFVMGGGSGKKDAKGHIEHGGKWRHEDEWPLSRAVETSFYLRADGGLSTEPGASDDAPVTWTHDPASPVPTVSGNVTGMYEWVPLNPGLDRAYIPQRARMKSVIPDGPLHQKERPETLNCHAPFRLLSERPDVMVFQTEPLAEDIEVTGSMRVHLWISSSAPDTDFTAKLLDIHPPSAGWPEGFHLPLADSIIRARFREGFDAERFMTPGQVYQVEIELPPISNLFVRGHRIRLDISSSNFPRFDVNPSAGEPLGRHTHMVKAENTVFLDAARPSHVTLPVVPTR